jgi:putative membrane protein
MKQTLSNRKHNLVAIGLFFAYIVLFAALAVAPHARAVWFAENMTILPIVVILALMYRFGYRFSTMAYVLMSVLVFLHTVGGHFTFERVPFGAVTRFFGWERNNYDRIAHASVGLYAFAVAEFVTAKRWSANRWMTVTFALCAIMAVAALYEIFEWQYAILSDPAAGLAVLGSQGDIWDAQKDMLCDTIGGMVGCVLYLVFGRKAGAGAASSK